MSEEMLGRIAAAVSGEERSPLRPMSSGAGAGRHGMDETTDLVAMAREVIDSEPLPGARHGGPGRGAAGVAGVLRA